MTEPVDTPVIFPVSLHLHGKCCLVIGGDTGAETRVRALLACEATVRLVSPQVTPWLATLAHRGTIQWEQGPVQPVHFTAVSVVFVTTQDPQIRTQIVTLAQQHPCLVHITDHPAQSDFSLPAVVRRGSLTLAISTAGQAPAFAAWLRKQLERLLDQRLGHVVEAYARLRPAMKQRYPDYATRAQAWEELLTAHQPALFASPPTETHAHEAAPHQP
jgi:siroheme synthase-like protein